MNPNVTPLSTKTLPPWKGVTEVFWEELLPGDVVIGRAASCGACMVLAVAHVNSSPYLVFYCCGGQPRPEGKTTLVAGPRERYGIQDVKPFHPRCTCPR